MKVTPNILTPLCSKALFVQKPESQDDNPSVRLVTNLKPVNKIVDKVGYPLDGSSLILRRLDPEGTCFPVVDMVQGFHQIPLHEDSRELMSSTGSPASPKDATSALTFLITLPTLRSEGRKDIIKMSMTSSLQQRTSQNWMPG